MSTATEESEPIDVKYNSAYQHIVLSTAVKTIDIPGLTYAGERKVSIADYKQALEEAELYGQPELIAQLQNNLACRYFSKDKYQQALTLLQSAVAWLEDQNDDDDPVPGNPDDETTIVIIQNLDSAQVMHHVSQEIFERLKRAEKYLRRGERDIADGLYDITSRYMRSHLGDAHWTLATVLCEWSICQKRLGNKGKAIHLLNEAAPMINRWEKRHEWLPGFFIKCKKEVLP